MTPEKDPSNLTWLAGVVGMVVSNVDTGIRTLIMTALAVLVLFLLGLGYSSLTSTISAGFNRLETGQCSLDSRLRTVESSVSRQSGLLEQHLLDSRKNGNGNGGKP